MITSLHLRLRAVVSVSRVSHFSAKSGNNTHSYFGHIFTCKMSTTTSAAPNGSAAKKPNGKKEIKILMLHGKICALFFALLIEHQIGRPGPTYDQ